MTTDTTIRTIRYRFELDQLFGDAGIDDFNMEASIQKYVQLCQEFLQQHYLDAEILVDYGSQSLIEVDGQRDGIDVQRIRVICDRIYETREWETQDDSPNIHQQEDVKLLNEITADDPQLPLAVLRWACEHNLIDAATKRSILWQAKPSLVRSFVDVHIRASSPLLDVWQVDQTEGETYCFIGWDYSNVLAYNLSDLKELRVKRLLFGDLSHFNAPRLFTRSNSFIELRLSNVETDLMLWLFSDVEEWFHPEEHSFSKFCKGFREEAIKLGLDAEIHAFNQAKSRNPCLFTLSSVQEPRESISLEVLLTQYLGQICNALENTELALLDGPVWKPIYETNERLFCEEVLKKLLHKMGFVDVNYSHGSTEFGKDFTFTEETSFGARRFYGLQAKAGNISGRVKGDMDEVLAQLDDAFSIPYRYSRQPEEQRFISAFVIAISGRFSDNAEEKIRWKLLKQGRLGAVYLWDKDTILEMINRYWFGKNTSDASKAWATNTAFLKT